MPTYRKIAADRVTRNSLTDFLEEICFTRYLRSVKSKEHLESGQQGGGEDIDVKYSVLCRAVSLHVKHPMSAQRPNAMCIVRGRPYMTSAKFSGFWTPSPLVRIWD